MIAIASDARARLRVTKTQGGPVKRIAALALVMVSLSCSQAIAQSGYPEKPIRIITNAAASLPDIVARVVQPHFEKSLGKPIIIENIGGAGGSVAAERAARAEAGGHTLLFRGAADTK